MTRQLVASIPFTPEHVRRHVPAVPGAYVLGDADAGRFRTGYIGRSDDNLRRRLAVHERLGEFSLVAVCPTTSSRSAFFAECEFWHGAEERGYELANEIHPATPRRSGEPCPYCHFARHALEPFTRTVGARALQEARRGTLR